MIQLRNSPKILRLLPYLVLAGLTALFVFRAFLGFDWSDEGYYLALPYRFVLGDRMFVDSWDIHQTGALLVAPVLWLYRLVVGDMTGVLLFMRLLFVAFQALAALLVYRAVLHFCHSRFPALLCAAISLSFVPFSISNFSYNTMGYLFIIISAMLILLLYQEPSFRASVALGLLSGVAFGCSSIAYPFFATVALSFAALLIGIRPVIQQRDGSEKKSLWPFFFVVIGAAATAVAAFLYAVSVSGISGIFSNLVYLFQDPEHPYQSVLVKTSLFLQDYYHLLFLGLLQVCLLVMILLYRMLKSDFDLGLVFRFLVKFFLPLCIMAGVAVVLVQPEDKLPATAKVNYIQGCAGLWPLILQAQRPSRRGAVVLLALYLPSVLMCWAIYVASNNGISGASYVLILSVMAAVLIIYDYFKGLEQEPESVAGIRLLKSTEGLMVTFAVMLVVCNAFLRMNTVYRDAGVPYLRVQMQTGPAKGIYTTPVSAADYEGVVTDIRKAAPKDGRIMFHELLPFGYLCTADKPAPPSLWRTKLPSERVDQYFALNPGNRPSLLYVVKSSYGYENNEAEVTEEEAEKLLGCPVMKIETEYSIQFIPYVLETSE